MRLVDWLQSKVTQDSRALGWFDHAECEDRIVRAYQELLEGYQQDPSKILKETRPIKGEHHGTVTVRDINYHSMCAHHFLPFFGKVSISYIPGESIIGLGKFPRLVQAYSRRFQIQEDLVQEIAEEVMKSGGARGVLVTATGRHMCICSRGSSDTDAITETSYSMGSLQGRVHHSHLGL
jgi:GTP cyclohydrolase I